MKANEIPWRTDLKWIGCDLDNTIAQGTWSPDNPTEDIGPPIWENVEKLKKLHKDGWKIFIHTSRSWNLYERIEAWLLEHDIPFKGIHCGKNLYAAYIDDRGINSRDEDWTPSW